MAAYSHEKIENPIAHIKDQCRHRWDTVLRNLAPQLSDAIEKNSRHAHNPVTGNEKGLRTLKTFREDGATYVCEGLGFANNDGIETLAYLLNSKRDAVRELMGYLRETTSQPAMAQKRKNEQQRNEAETRAKEKSEVIRKKANLTQIANRCVDGFDGDDALLMRYFNHRKIANMASDDIPADVFLVEDLKYYHESDKGISEGVFPAMVSAVRNSKNEIVSFHRTYLSHTGSKAEVEDPKKLMESIRTISEGAIRLYQPNKVLGLAEGIETAIAVRSATKMPIWSTINANGLVSVAIPEGITHVVIWADLDASGTGQNAAIRLHHRLVESGYSVTIMLPPGSIPKGCKSVDWLDVLVQSGVKAFPSVKRIMEVDHPKQAIGSP